MCFCGCLKTIQCQQQPQPQPQQQQQHQNHTVGTIGNEPG